MSQELNDSNSNNGIMTPLLSMMMFLQFFTWGAWFATLSAVLDSNGLSAFKGGAYESVPIAAIFAPLFLGLIADRLFSSEKVMGVLLVLGGIIMALIPLYAIKQADDAGDLIVWLILGHSLCFMPTLGLGNTIAFTHIPTQNDFPKIRVWGTIGWIAAGLVGGGLGWSNSFNLFWMGSIAAVLLGVFCFFLPNTPPPLKGKPLDIRSLLMVDAFKLLKDFNFAIFALCSTLICIPLAYYYGLTGTYLNQTGFSQSAATMTLGQMSEIFFMLLIPFFFRRLGLKLMILIGMGCWVIRYGLFALGAPDQVSWMLLLAVLVHGICYDFFFVTGFMYTDDKAPKDIRGQAQSLLVFLTQGIGMFFGFRIAFGGSFGPIPLNWHIGEWGKQVASSDQYNEALKVARGQGEELGFFESFSQMFSRSLPEGLDGQLLGTTMGEWKDYWMFPAIMAAVVFILFALLFHDKMSTKEVDESDVAEASLNEEVV